MFKIYSVAHIFAVALVMLCFWNPQQQLTVFIRKKPEICTHLPWPFRPPGISGSDRTDTCSFVSCPRDSSCQPDRHTSNLSAQFSAKIHNNKLFLMFWWQFICKKNEQGCFSFFQKPYSRGFYLEESLAALAGAHAVVLAGGIVATHGAQHVFFDGLLVEAARAVRVHPARGRPRARWSRRSRRWPQRQAVREKNARQQNVQCTRGISRWKKWTKSAQQSLPWISRLCYVLTCWFCFIYQMDQWTFCTYRFVFSSSHWRCDLLNFSCGPN